VPRDRPGDAAPFGLLLFVAKGASPQTSMREIIASAAPSS
jgi:hypothetical protein